MELSVEWLETLIDIGFRLVFLLSLILMIRKFLRDGEVRIKTWPIILTGWRVRAYIVLIVICWGVPFLGWGFINMIRTIWIQGIILQIVMMVVLVILSINQVIEDRQEDRQHYHKSENEFVDEPPFLSE